MSVKNFYPELPETTYNRTTVEMPIVVKYAKTLIEKYSLPVVRMAYAIFRLESGNGSKGVNGNFAGIQADDARWTGLQVQPTATMVKKDSGGQIRRFLCFDNNGYQASFEFLCIKVKQRDMVTAMDYFKKWKSNGTYNPSDAELSSFNSLLNSAKKAFGE